MKWLAIIAFVLCFCMGWRLSCQVDFYRAYFNEKQRNLGKDPDDSLREMWGRWWWWFR